MTHEIRAARNGDLTAFARLVETHHASVCAITTAILGDPVAGEDAAQEAFLIGWRKLAQLEDPQRFPEWLRQIARNTARMHHRSARRRPDAVAASAVDVAAPAASAEDALQEAEASTVLAEAVAQLPEDVREVLVLYYREGRSTAEVASSLALSEAAVRKRLSRARETLKADVEARFGGWMERTRPRAGFVAAVLVAIGLSGRAEAATRRPVRWSRTVGWVGASIVLGGSAVAWLFASWTAPELTRVASAGENDVARHAPGVSVPRAEIEPSPEVASAVPPPPARTEPAPTPIREALLAVARAGEQRLVRCDVSALGLNPVELASELALTLPPAVDVADGILTFLTTSSEGGYHGVSFRDQSLAMTLEPGGPGSVTTCTVALAPPFEAIIVPHVVPHEVLDEELARGVEETVEHDEHVTPLHLALEDPELSDAARTVLEGWLAHQADEADRKLLRAQMWADHPEMTLTIQSAEP